MVGSRNARTHYQRTTLQHLRRRRAPDLCVWRAILLTFLPIFFFFLLLLVGGKKCEL